MYRILLYIFLTYLPYQQLQNQIQTEEGKRKREESVKMFDEFMDRVIARAGEKEIS